jgi:hypothetical protein
MADIRLCLGPVRSAKLLEGIDKILDSELGKHQIGPTTWIGEHLMLDGQLVCRLNLRRSTDYNGTFEIDLYIYDGDAGNLIYQLAESMSEESASRLPSRHRFSSWGRSLAPAA